MSRAGDGTYSLPLPDVVAGDDIEASWANTTMDDIATEMQDSLSRSGKGGMSAALKLASGTVSAPGLSFTSEANSGLYRASAGDIRGAVGGADIWRMTSAGFQQYVSAAWTSPVVLAGAQTITGAKTFDASPIIGVAGQGIDFAIQTATAATGAATTAEVLNHYEQGTWTPNLWDATLSSSESQTYADQDGHFIRIGKLVIFWGDLTMSSLGTLTTSATARIGPLPFTSVTGFGISVPIMFGPCVNFSLSAAGTIYGYIVSNTNYFTLASWLAGSTTTQANVTIAEITASGGLSFSGMYVVT